LIRALSRAAVRMLAAVTVSYTLIAAVTVLSGSTDVLAWIGILSTAGFVASLPIVLITRISFGRRLRAADSALTEALGFFGRWQWDGARRLVASQACLRFLWRGEYRTLQDWDLRRAARVYAVVHGMSLVLAFAMLGSMLVIVSVALSWLPKP
jgi:hypothetical protein